MSDHGRSDTQIASVAPALSWQALRIAAEIYADFMQFRIAATNRAERGGVPAEEFAPLLDGLNKQEAALKKELQLRYRAAVPVHIRAWQAETVGLGEHTFARLLGILGDPRTAQPWHWEGKGKCPKPVNGTCSCDPRTHRHLVADPTYERSVSQLWSYCGVGDSTRRRMAGMDVDDALACGSPRLRSLLFVIAEGCMKNRLSPYRVTYEERRAVTAERVHAAPCVRCGPPGKPATDGTPWKDAHKLADALRIVAKEILRDLWLAADEGAIATPEPKAGTPPSAVSQGGELAIHESEPRPEALAAGLTEDVA
jgi:hypothetical protein